MSEPITQSDLEGSGIILSTSAETAGKIGATLQVAGPLGVMASVGILVGVEDAFVVGTAVAVGASVRVGLPIVARWVSVGILGPNRAWQADNKRMLVTITARLMILRAVFIV